MKKNGFLSIEIQNTRIEIINNFKSFFDLAYELNKFCHEIIELLPDKKDQRKYVYTLLFIRIIHTYNALIILAEHGLITQSRILLRSIVEAWYIINAICQEDSFLKDYLNNGIYNINKILKGADEVGLHSMQNKSIIELYDDIKQEVKNKKINDIRIYSLAEKAKLLDNYKILYTDLSRDVHSIITNLDSEYTIKDSNGNTKGIGYGPNQKYLKETLLFTLLTVLDTSEIISDVFEFNYTKKIHGFNINIRNLVKYQ